MNTTPLPASALVLVAILLMPTVAATPVQTRPADLPFLAMEDIVDDTLEFIGALDEAQSAEEKANAVVEFLSSASGKVFSQLCQYLVDRNLGNLTPPVEVNTSDRVVEWRLPTRDNDGQVAVSYHRFKYDPNDLGCEEMSRPSDPGAPISPKPEPNLPVDPGVMLLLGRFLN